MNRPIFDDEFLEVRKKLRTRTSIKLSMIDTKIFTYYVLFDSEAFHRYGLWW